MKNRLANFILALACSCLAASAQAEKSTELYIPIGQSPGLSGEYTRLGTIASVDLDSGTVAMTGGARRYTVKVTERTSIYLDRSKSGKTSTYGSLSDCRPGMQAEVKYMGKQRQGEAEWLKLQIE